MIHGFGLITNREWCCHFRDGIGTDSSSNSSSIFSSSTASWELLSLPISRFFLFVVLRRQKQLFLSKRKYQQFQLLLRGRELFSNCSLFFQEISSLTVFSVFVTAEQELPQQQQWKRSLNRYASLSI